jgi:hypothetical protein
MRERLIHLLRECNTCVNDNCADCKDCFLDGEELCDIHVTADHLLAGGVIAPPCEIEQEVFVMDTIENGLDKPTKMKCIGFAISHDSCVVNLKTDKNKLYQPGFGRFGKSVFHTEQELQQAIDQRKEGRK